MNKNGVYDNLVDIAKKRGAGFFILIDPDKTGRVGDLFPDIRAFFADVLHVHPFELRDECGKIVGETALLAGKIFPVDLFFIHRADPFLDLCPDTEISKYGGHERFA